MATTTKNLPIRLYGIFKQVGLKVIGFIDVYSNVSCSENVITVFDYKTGYKFLEKVKASKKFGKDMFLVCLTSKGSRAKIFPSSPENLHKVKPGDRIYFKLGT